VIHLDTNFLIDALVPGSAQDAQLTGWLGAGETHGVRSPMPSRSNAPMPGRRRNFST